MPAERLPQALLLALLFAAPAPARADEPPETPPDAELLEFIATFATDDGGWLDPFELDVAAVPEESTEEEHQ